MEDGLTLVGISKWSMAGYVSYELYWIFSGYLILAKEIKSKIWTT
jgi:hypothetical protein